jgi:hypothetical protein
MLLNTEHLRVFQISFVPSMKQPRENCDVKFVLALELDLIANDYLVVVIDFFAHSFQSYKISKSPSYPK